MNNRKNYITILSVISAIAVVLLHTNGCFWSFGKERYWVTANIIECVFFFAVPIFFMISGANLIDYQEKYSTKEFFIKRLKKAVIPYFIWSILWIIYAIIAKHIPIKWLSPSYIFNGFFSSTVMSVYWFFLPLFGIYLCMPLFASVDKEKRIKVFSYIVLVSFVTYSLLPFVFSVFKLNFYYGIPFWVGSGYLIYPLLGYILDKKDISKKLRIIIYILAILGLLAHIIGTQVLSFNAGEIIKTYKGYCNVPSLFYSVGIFVFVKEISKKIKNFKIVNFLSKYTFAIYLMHMFIIDIICMFIHVNHRSIYYRLGMPLIVIPICILITYLMRKIPIIKKIVP